MPKLYVVLVTVRVHESEDRVLVPFASLLVLTTEVSVKELALLLKFRVTSVFTSAALKIPPLANRKV